MLLLFILIGLLALGLPLIIFLLGDPPPPEPPVKPKAAVVQIAPVAAPIEVPQAARSETAAAPAATTPNVLLSDPISIPGLPDGTKMPTEAELLKELQRLLDERAKSGK